MKKVVLFLINKSLEWLLAISATIVAYLILFKRSFLWFFRHEFKNILFSKSNKRLSKEIESLSITDFSKGLTSYSRVNGSYIFSVLAVVLFFCGVLISYIHGASLEVVVPSYLIFTIPFYLMQKQLSGDYGNLPKFILEKNISSKGEESYSLHELVELSFIPAIFFGIPVFGAFSQDPENRIYFLISFLCIITSIPFSLYKEKDVVTTK